MGYIRQNFKTVSCLCRKCQRLPTNIPDNVDISDYQNRGRNRVYKTTCRKCGIDRGYKLISECNKVCIVCAKDNKRLFPPHVDKDDFLNVYKDNGSICRLFRHRCSSCRANIGYRSYRSGKSSLCPDCVIERIHSRKFDQKTRQKMRNNHHLKNGGTHPLKGKHHSDKTKAKLSQAAAKQLKKYDRSDFIYRGVCMRSSWEVKYAKYLDKNKIQWEYEPEFKLSNGKVYLPDFKLQDNVIIEIKGFWRKDALQKWQLFEQDYPEIEKRVLMKQELKNLGLEV